MSVFERDESSTTDAGNRFVAGSAAFRKQATETIGAAWFVITRSETLTGQVLVAMGAGETVTVPRFVLVSYATSLNCLIAFNATSGEFFFIATGAVDILFTRDKALGTNWRFACTTFETLFMPLPVLVFHFLGSGMEDVSASIALGCKLLVIAITAVDLLALGSKLLVNQ